MKQEIILERPLHTFIQAYAYELQSQKIIPELLQDFQKSVWEFYKSNRRPFDWRDTITPYGVVVSEIMLQQTQTQRVEKKYAEFIAKFRNFNELAAAPFSEVLKLWVGLGYNRRAQNLHGIAQKVVSEYGGQLPSCVQALTTFKGLGHNTASSIVSFAFNKPTVFVETNIRAVFLHTFFAKCDEVHDKELLPLVAQTVDLDNPREWYYALMDIGALFKKIHKNPSRKSKHHTRQSKFEGSDRQIRGAVLRELTQKITISEKKLFELLNKDSDRVQKILHDLEQEQFICKRGQVYQLKG